jgi:hypothetical protein
VGCRDLDCFLVPDLATTGGVEGPVPAASSPSSVPEDFAFFFLAIVRTQCVPIAG